MYLPLSRSLLARRAAAGSSNAQHNSSSGWLHTAQREAQNTAANSVWVINQGAGAAAAAGAAARCMWLQTVADVREGEELVVVQQQQLGDCDWPGLRLSTS